MTVNKLKMNSWDKKELVVLNASHRQPSPLMSISVCDEVISKSSVATILVTNLETLVCVSPSPMLIWVLITVVLVLQNTRVSTLGKEMGTFE